MIKKHLGTTIDIHGGGRDLIFPHHENEIAQRRCAHGGDYVRYWMHAGLLVLMVLALALEEVLHAKKSMITGLFAIVALLAGSVAGHFYSALDELQSIREK